ncbi:MAG: ATP-dependent helicase C-terminal domain-containing protein [Puniceicoccaceae bacterium]
MLKLPVDDFREEILARFGESRRLVVVAPPGSGKSTRVPRFLLEGSGVGEVVVLQPRRLAARMLAARVADELGVEVGGLVGYEVRFDRKVSGNTRLRFVTEGVFLRQLEMGNPLDPKSVVVMDEFHERHIEGDLILGALQWRAVQGLTVPGICIMSATLDASAASRWLGGAPILEVPGSLHPVETLMNPAKSRGGKAEALWDHAARAVGERIERGIEGSILVFMPGVGEIHRTLECLRRERRVGKMECLPLYGELKASEQERAVAAVAAPRVIVSTNIAETSLTIPGVRHVIDSGLCREKVFDAEKRINFLEVRRISRDAADQRRGRAGRLGPGTCDRLWSEKEDMNLSLRSLPEVERIDLSDAFLRNRMLGAAGPADFPWPEAPAPERMKEGEDLLELIGMITERGGQMTERGRRAAALPVHPRLAAILLAAEKRPLMRAAALGIVALLQERPILRRTRDPEVLAARADEDQYEGASDLLVEILWLERALEGKLRKYEIEELGLAPGALAEAVKAREALRGSLGWEECYLDEGSEVREIGYLMAAGFPDLIARRKVRGGSSWEVAAGLSGRLEEGTLVTRADWVVAGNLRSSRIKGVPTVLLSRLSRFDPSWLEKLYPNLLDERVEVDESPANGGLESVKERRFLGLQLAREVLGPVGPEVRGPFFATMVMQEPKRLKGWDEEVESWIAKVNFAAREARELEIEPIDEAARRLLVEMICEKVLRPRDLRTVEVWPVLKNWLTPEQERALEVMVPATYPLEGRKKPAEIDYGTGEKATLSATVQELWKEKHVPSILGGRYPLYLEILAPNRRPIQVTRDLTGFWTGSYESVRKEMAGRYPKHDWPPAGTTPW